MRAFPIIVAGAVGALIGWLVLCGGQVFLPVIDRETESRHWSDYLLACRPDEMRVQTYISGQECQKAVLNLITGELVGAPAPPVIEYGPFWQRIISVFHTINFADRKPYTASELTEIKSALARVTPPPVLDRALHHEQFHLAFYRENHCVLYDYPRAEANEALRDLFHALHFTLEHDLGDSIYPLAQ